MASIVKSPFVLQKLLNRLHTPSLRLVHERLGVNAAQPSHLKGAAAYGTAFGAALSASRTYATTSHPPEQPPSSTSTPDSSPSKAPVTKPRRANTRPKASFASPLNTSQPARPLPPKTPPRRNRLGSEGGTDYHSPNKTVFAYCAAESYALEDVSRYLRGTGYEVDPMQTGLWDQVIHVRAEAKIRATPPASQEKHEHEVKDDDPVEKSKRKVTKWLESLDQPEQEQGDIFIFSSGTLVAWNVSTKTINHLLHRVLSPAAKGRVREVETEYMEYFEDEKRSTSDVKGDVIILGTRGATAENDVNFADTKRRPETDALLTKMAFSSGLARSTKLAVLESRLDDFVATTSTSSLARDLSRAWIPFARRKRFLALRKTEELLSLRAQLNLSSELTDSLPDLFWDSPHELGLEEYYTQIAAALNVHHRIELLNEKMTYASEEVGMMREALSERHGLSLEWLIILLISVEVGFEVERLWEHRKERENPKSLENMMRRWLEREEQRQQS